LRSARRIRWCPRMRTQGAASDKVARTE
jgi:hypothetical protein